MLRVKNIHYIMASLHVGDSSSSSSPSVGIANLRIGESKIPRGLTVQLKVTLHDNMGNEILHNWDATEHLGYAVARRDGLTVHIDSEFQLTVSFYWWWWWCCLDWLQIAEGLDYRDTDRRVLVVWQG